MPLTVSATACACARSIRRSAQKNIDGVDPNGTGDDVALARSARDNLLTSSPREQFASFRFFVAKEAAAIDKEVRIRARRVRFENTSARSGCCVRAFTTTTA